MTRYYGLYARYREIDKSLHKAVSKSKRRILLDFNTWRKLILFSFGYDPLQCPKCNHQMEFLELYYNHKPVSLEVLYERALAKYRCPPVANLLDLFSCLLHTECIIKTGGFTMDS